MQLKPLDEIAKTSIQILLNEPFYGHFMMGMPKELTDKVDTAAVTLMNRQMVKLVVNPRFWEELNEKHRYGLIKHEVLHVVLKHLLAYKNFSNKNLFNIAADLVVNQYIEPEQLPDGGLTLERFAYLKPMYGIELERDKDVGYYYQQLKKVLGMQPKMPLSAIMDMMGNSGDKDGDGPIILTDLFLEENSELKRHQFWDEIEQLSPGEQKVIEHQINNVIKQTVNRVKQKSSNYGNLPAGLKEMLDFILEDMQAKFNWRRILRLFAASSNSTFLKNTIRRSSKRYGTTPGIKVKRHNRLLLAIDTSGSIRKTELEEFFSEIYFIWRQGAEIYIVECDTHIHKQYRYRGILPTHIQGGGGTSFNEPIKFANEEYRPDALIYFTDGFAAVPVVPARYPVLWVISSQGLKEGDGIWNELPGKKIKMG